MIEIAAQPQLHSDSMPSAVTTSEPYSGHTTIVLDTNLDKKEEKTRLGVAHSVGYTEDEGFHSDKNPVDSSSGEETNSPVGNTVKNANSTSKHRLDILSTQSTKTTPRLSPRRDQENGMDLKQQLVIWKKASFLLDNIAITPVLCEKLIEEGIFTTEMINQVQSKVYNVEKNLMLLTLLGTFGTDVYEGFLKALWESDHTSVVKELRRTFTHTKFGEMLPPSFTYFMDLDEFLRKYPHIGLKLGEEGKHLLHSFIEGKIEVEARKRGEYIDKLKADRDRLLKVIDSMKKELSEYKAKLQEAELKLKHMEGRIESLKNRIKELEESNKEQRTEIRRLKHFHKQQKDLDFFLKEEADEFLPKAPKVYVRETSKMQEATRPELETQEKLSFQLLQSQVNVQIIKMDLAKANVIHLNKEEKRLQELKSTLQLKTKELERQKSNLDRQMSNLSRSKSNLSRTRFNLRSAAVRKKSSIVPPESRKVSTESRGDGKADETHESRIGKEIKEFVLEIKRTKKVLEQQLKEGERDLMRKEKELDMKEKEFNTARDYKINTYSDLTTKLKGVIENMKKLYSSKQSDMMRKHDKEINEFIQRLQDMNLRHLEEVAHLRGRIKQKMMEIYRRETLHKKLRKQINVLCNYQAKNMNATVSVEQCRKIVRGIIGDARKLRAIAEERDLREDEKMEEENDGEKEKEEKMKAKKKKVKKRKKYQALADDHLAYVAERIYLDWRILGKKLGMTNNRMDMIEIDVPPGQVDKCTFNMLKIWRDEENGKSEQLYTALMDMNRSELAVVVIPKKRLVNAQTVNMDELRRNPEGPALPQIVEPSKDSVGEGPKGAKSSKRKVSNVKKPSQPSAPIKLPQLVSPTK